MENIQQLQCEIQTLHKVLEKQEKRTYRLLRRIMHLQDTNNDLRDRLIVYEPDDIRL
jgi:hypothetical protein